MNCGADENLLDIENLTKVFSLRQGFPPPSWLLLTKLAFS